ncbi:MAG: flagellar motor stator protein MotA [Bryobacteraceae bacterium]|nr:flagellar motor stator protein MotA [Bryobacteraceae bacterium]
MFAIIGIIVVLGAVIGGYLMEHGHIMVLMQPAEFLIIGGSALGATLVGNPLYVLKGIGGNLLMILKPDHYNQSHYLKTLQMLYALFSTGRKQGDQALEAEIEDPENGASFSSFPHFVKDKKALAYVCDTLRMSLMGGAPYDLDTLMELDAETQEAEEHEPVSALQTTADALPGFGIVAAVLGVVVTMGALGGPPEEIGHKVAAALVGTFLGILLCYGVLGPLAALLGKHHDSTKQYFACLRSAVIAYAKGSSPLMSVEYGRRVIPTRNRPTFSELEGACKGGGAEAKAEAA